MKDLTDADRTLDAELTRRRLLEVGVLGLAALVMPGCGNSAAAPIGSGVGASKSSGGVGPTSGAASTGTGGSGSGLGTSRGGTSGTTGTGGFGATSSAGTSSGGTTGGAMCKSDANTFMTSVNAMPALGQIGQIAFFTDNRYADSICGQNAFLIVQKASGEYVALSASCTHQCSVPPAVQQRGQLIYCALHGSEYNFDGSISRAAVLGQQNLPTLPICIDGSGNIFVQLA